MNPLASHGIAFSWNGLIYNRHFFPSISGKEISGRIMACELVKRGHTVTLVTATPLPEDERKLKEGYRIIRSEHLTTLVRLARANDVPLSRGGFSLRALLAALWGNLPFVVFHESDASAGRSGASFRRHATDAVKALLRRRLLLHVVVSVALRGKLNLPVGANWCKLYNPVSEDLWTASPVGFGQRDIHVLFVGRLLADKGLMVLRNALGALPTGKRLRITIVGDGDDRSALEDRFRKVAGEVTFLGCITGVQLRDLFTRAQILVVPSLVQEGMGMVAAEKLANGTPVCASDQPALWEVVVNTGFFTRSTMLYNSLRPLN